MSDAETTTSRTGTERAEPPGLTPDDHASTIWAIVLAGAFIWFAHFGLVYLVAEAACRFDLLGAEVAGLTVLSVVILASTAVAVIATVVPTVMALRRWRADPPDDADSSPGGLDHPLERDRALAFVGFILNLLFIVAVLAVGLPALVLAPC